MKKINKKMKKSEKIKKKSKFEKFQYFKKEFKKQIVIAILAAFGFLIALSWRDFISEFVNYIILYFKLEGSLSFYKLITALLITFISVIGIMIISKFNVKE